MHNDGVDLRARLESFQFDDAPARYGFADRLAKENGWSKSFAQRAIREYLRFMYLAAVARHPVTPSEEVDQVWHLHMIYTRSYWERLCGQVLGKPIHHEPTKGGGKESAKFIDWYERTKASYRAIFGDEPPPDLWPETSHRFEDSFARVDRRTHWVIGKPRRSRVAWAIGLGGVALGAAGCATMLAQQPSQTNAGGTMLGVIVVGALVVLVGVVIAIVRGAAQRQPRVHDHRADSRGDSGYVPGTMLIGCGGGHATSHGHGGGDGAPRPEDATSPDPNSSPGGGGPDGTGSSHDGGGSGDGGTSDAGSSGCGASSGCGSGGGCGGGGGD